MRTLLPARLLRSGILPLTGVRVQSFKDGADSVTVFLDSGAAQELEVDYVMVTP